MKHSIQVPQAHSRFNQAWTLNFAHKNSTNYRDLKTVALPVAAAVEVSGILVEHSDTFVTLAAVSASFLLKVALKAVNYVYFQHKRGFDWGSKRLKTIASTRGNFYFSTVFLVFKSLKPVVHGVLEVLWSVVMPNNRWHLQNSARVERVRIQHGSGNAKIWSFWNVGISIYFCTHVRLHIPNAKRYVHSVVRRLPSAVLYKLAIILCTCLSSQHQICFDYKMWLIFGTWISNLF